MQRIVRGVEIEHDLARRLVVRVQKQIDEQPFNRRAVMVDLMVARLCALGRGGLQAIERALAGERSRFARPAIELAGQHAEKRIEPQLVVVEQVFVAERQAKTRCATGVSIS